MADGRTRYLDPWDETDERLPRELENRDNFARDERWAPPGVLPEPDPRPGWDHRWVRVSIVGKPDNRNVSMRFREGWEPVKSSDYPEMLGISDLGGRFTDGGHIEIGGLVLCRIPTETVKQRRGYYDNLAKRQMEGVDESYMRESDHRMPMLKTERSTRTTFGREEGNY